jgi:hypothetical protein
MGTLPLALFGSGSYGARLGSMALPRQLLAAVAPFVLAGLIGYFGTTTALVALAGVALLGLAAFLEVARIRRRRVRSTISLDAAPCVAPRSSADGPSGDA